VALRTWGRVTDGMGNLSWVEVTTDANGFNDLVYVTTLAQVIRGMPNESPFYGNYGIPSIQAVQQTIPPDFYMSRTQQQFAQYFASLIITRAPSNPSARPGHAPSPAYNVFVVAKSGAILPNVTVSLQGYSESVPT
jgi:hypothetical protein